MCLYGGKEVRMSDVNYQDLYLQQLIRALNAEKAHIARLDGRLAEIHSLKSAMQRRLDWLAEQEKLPPDQRHPNYG
jgi:hypothetical protein